MGLWPGLLCLTGNAWWRAEGHSAYVPDLHERVVTGKGQGGRWDRSGRGWRNGRGQVDNRDPFSKGESPGDSIVGELGQLAVDVHAEGP